MAAPEEDQGNQNAEAEEVEVFMPEEEGTVVADLEGQASESEDEDEDEGEGDDMMEGDEELPPEVFEVERDDACACLVAEASSAEPSGSSAPAPAPKPVYAVKWNKANPGIVACGGEDDKVRLWKPFHVGGPNSITLSIHEDSVVALDFDSTGKLLASGGMDGRVCIWSAMTGKLLTALEGPGEAIEFVKWHPLGRVILAGSEDYTLWMWNISTSSEAGAGAGEDPSEPSTCQAQCMQVFTGHNQSVTCGGFTPNGKVVVSSSLDGTLRVWNPRTGECQHTFDFRDQVSQWSEAMEAQEEEELGITCLDFSADSTMVLCGSMDGAAHLVNINTNRVLWKLGGAKGGQSSQTHAHSMGQELPRSHHDSVETVAFHPGGQPLVATGSLDGNLIVWDANLHTPRVACSHPRGVIRAQWVPSAATNEGGPTSLHLYTCCLDGRVRLWDARSGKCERDFVGFTQSLLDMDLGPDGTTVIAGSDDGTARVFKANS